MHQKNGKPAAGDGGPSGCVLLRGLNSLDNTAPENHRQGSVGAIGAASTAIRGIAAAVVRPVRVFGRSVDLYALKRNHGGSVYSGGRRWVGPGPGHSRQDESLSVFLTDDGRTLVHSFAGDPFVTCASYLGLATDNAAPLDRATREGLESLGTAERERRRNFALAFCETVWRTSVPLEGSPGAAYLDARAIGWFPADVRFHPAAPRGYQCDAKAPALIALARSVTGAPKAIQATFLTPDGRARTSRATFGALIGATVNMGPSGQTLAIAEGLETAASFAELEGVVTWAMLGTANLEAFTPPVCVSRLIIAADGDEPGLKSARLLADRLRRRCDVTIMPAPSGADWNDVATGKAHV